MSLTKTSQPRISRLLLLSAIASSIGSFLFGFDTAVISGTTASLKEVFNLTDTQLGFTVSSALFGALAGAALVGKPSEKWGRIRSLFVLALLYLISALGCAWSNDLTTLIIFRFIGGLAVGGASVVSPMYITEITPPAKRGLLVAVSQLSIVVGILAALISNYYVVKYLGAEPTGSGWRWMFGIEAVPAALFLLTAFIIPESPRWLIHKGRVQQATEILKKLGYSKPEVEAKAIQSSFTSNGNEADRESLFQRRYFKPLALVICLALFNQLDGINAILYYITDIFKMAGFAAEDAFKQGITIGLVNLVFTILGMALIDKLGRKTLLLIGSITFILSHLLAAWVFLTGNTSWLAILAAAGICGSHAYSQGAVIWVCINELLPNAVRAAGSATACFILWGAAIVVSTAFPVVIGSWGGYTFLIFAAMMLVQFFFVWFLLPETKGKPLEEIEQELTA